MSWEVLALLGASAAVKSESDRDVQRRQKKIIDAMEQFQTSRAKEGEGAIDKFIAESSPQQRAAQNASVRDELRSGLGQSVGSVQSFEKPDNFSGRVSESYATRAASNKAAVNDRIKRAMDQLAIIGTPAETGVRQAIRFGRSASDVDAANAAIGRVVPAYEGAVSRVRPSPWEEFFSQALAGGAQAYSGRRVPRTRSVDYDLDV